MRKKVEFTFEFVPATDEYDTKKIIEDIVDQIILDVLEENGVNIYNM